MREFGRNRVLFVVAILAFASPSVAQVCREAGGPSGGPANVNCDMSYRNAPITCGHTSASAPLGTYPACPSKPMPMIDTPMGSYIRDYSPFLYSYPRDPANPTKPYSGSYSVGTKGDATSVFQMAGESPTGVEKRSACTVSLFGTKDPANADELAKITRLQLDSCTNEYILQWATAPVQKELPTSLSGENPANPGMKVDLASACQPLRTIGKDDNEYLASEYLEVAWKKMLQDPGYRKTTPKILKDVACVGFLPCDREPHLPKGTIIKNPLPMPQESEVGKLKEPGAKFPEVLLSTIAAIPYEEIIDPTHPFSPRWDFKLNDRQYAEPSAEWGTDTSYAEIIANYALMYTYTNSPTNSVFCAGLRKQNMFDKYTSLYNKLSDGFTALKNFDFNSLSTDSLGNLFTQDNFTSALTKLGVDPKIVGAFTGDSDIMNALSKMADGDYSYFEKLSDDQMAKFNAMKEAGLSKLNGISTEGMEASLAKGIQALQKIDPQGMLDQVNWGAFKDVTTSMESVYDKAKDLNISQTVATGVTQLASMAETYGFNADDMTDFKKWTEQVGTKYADVLNDPKKALGTADFADKFSAAVTGGAAKLPDIASATSKISSAVGSIDNFSSLSGFYAQAKTVMSSPAVLGNAKDIIAAGKSIGMDANTAIQAMKDIGEKGKALDPLKYPEAKKLMDKVTAMGNPSTYLTDATKLVTDLSHQGLGIGQLRNSFDDLGKSLTAGVSMGQFDEAMTALKDVQKEGASFIQSIESLSTIGDMMKNGFTFDNINSSLKLTGNLGIAGISFPDVSQYTNLLDKFSAKGLSGKQLANAGSKLLASKLLDEKSPENDTEIKVDVLEFRRKAFEKTLFGRVNYNAACYAHKADTGVYYDEEGLAMTLKAACFDMTWTGSVTFPPYFKFTFKDCWKCFDLNGRLTGETSPPCSHNYLNKDRKMKMWGVPMGVSLPGGLNLYNLEAQCQLLGGSNESMSYACEQLRRPYTPLNKLKMRYHNPYEPKNNAMTEGVPEGMAFRDYFGNHMPYPRLWDTGTSLQKTPASNTANGPVLDTTGQYSTIVGVGREGMPQLITDAAPKAADGTKVTDPYSDQRCKTMGWGKPEGIIASGVSAAQSKLDLKTAPSISFAGLKVYIPDPVSSWTEMKLYQTRTMRQSGMSCLGRYEKVFKQGSAENMILMATGVELPVATVLKCSRKTVGACTGISLEDYKKLSNPENDKDFKYTITTKNEGFPNAWRGYMASTLLGGKYKFPNFGGEGTINNMLGSSGVGNLLGNKAASYKGLDNAQLGDIILLPFGPSGNQAKPGLAKLAMVIETNLPSDSGPGENSCNDDHDCYVKVFEPDNGKFPDVCGTTDTWNEMKARKYYKPGHLPQEAVNTYKSISSPETCEETRITPCVMDAWDSLKIYRIRNDERKPCNKKNAYECK